MFSLFKSSFKRDGSDPADTVVLRARIITCNQNKPRAEALAVKGERIVYVGNNYGAFNHIGPGTRVINARRRTLTPGFVDSHCHVLWIGALQALMTTELYKCNSLAEVKQVMIRYDKANPDLPFVMGLGWRYDYLEVGNPTVG
jgi:predicted amidohydrolase YtcJ